VTERQFIEAYEAYSAKIYRYCLFRTNSRPEAEDLAADAFRKLLECRKPPEADLLLPWLYRVAKNLCVNHQNSQSRQRLRARLLGKSPEPAAEDPSGAWHDPELLAAVRTLKPREQQILFLRVFEDLSFFEVGQIVGISESAAKVAFHRSKRTLRSLLEESQTSRAGHTPLLGIAPEGENYGT
jgi:RNA polymerase sigma factor (sigma-70 family)